MTRAFEEAAQWHARLEAPDCTTTDVNAFKQWLQASDENANAFAAAEALCAELAGNTDLMAMAEKAFEEEEELQAERGQRVVALDSRRPPSVPEAKERAPGRGERAKAWISLASAACVCLALFVGWQILPGERSAEPMVYQTEQQRQRLHLADGSQVVIDAHSAISVAITARKRLVTLTRGRAVFDVVHDADRPFVVEADGSRTTALGTRFEVFKDKTAIVVTLEEGRVEVKSRAGDTAQLVPGQQSRLDRAAENPHWSVARVDLDVVTSWTKGRHTFRDERLESVVAQVNRYTDVKIRLGDPSLANLRVSGNFKAGDSAIVVDALEAAFPLRVADLDNELVLFPVYDVDSLRSSDSVQ